MTFDKGDNFCDNFFIRETIFVTLFSCLHTSFLLKRGLLYKERICSHRFDPFSEESKLISRSSFSYFFTKNRH